LELFSASGEARWLDWAIALQRRLDELFWDGGSGGWFSTTGSDASVLVRMKEDYDGAEPSASSVGAFNLLTLAHLTGDDSYRTRADAVFRAFGARLLAHGRTLPMMAAALSTALSPPEQIVIVGNTRQSMKDLWRAANSRYRPFAQLIAVESGEAQRALAALLPWIEAMTPLHDTAAAYVCHNFSCDVPTTEPARLA
jgi:uncharacterized protein